jgi:predicted nucleic acid-binding protein
VAKIFFDSNLFIYIFENNSVFSSRARTLRERMISAQAELVTCTMALGEVMTGPRKAGNIALSQRYGDAIRQTSTVVPFDDHAANIYSAIRAENRVSQPDGIQLACAAAHGVELFVTNDGELCKLRVPGIHFIVSIETALSLIP